MKQQQRLMPNMSECGPSVLKDFVTKKQTNKKTIKQANKQTKKNQPTTTKKNKKKCKISQMQF